MRRHRRPSLPSLRDIFDMPVRVLKSLGILALLSLIMVVSCASPRQPDPTSQLKNYPHGYCGTADHPVECSDNPTWKPGLVYVSEVPVGDQILTCVATDGGGAIYCYGPHAR